MYMIRHHHECVQFDVRVMVDKIMPAIHHDAAVWAQVHFAADNVSEQAMALIGAHGDKVRAWTSVVVRREADGSTLSLRSCCDHYCFSEISFCVLGHLQGRFQTCPYDAPGRLSFSGRTARTRLDQTSTPRACPPAPRSPMRRCRKQGPAPCRPRGWGRTRPASARTRS